MDHDRPPTPVRIWLSRTFEAARPEVAQDLQRLGRDVFGRSFDFEIAEHIEAPDGGDVPGAYNPATRVAYIALRADEAGMTQTLWHEGLHHLRNAGAFTAPDGEPTPAWRTLEREAVKTWRKRYEIDQRYDADARDMDAGERESLMNEEAIAEALADYQTRGHETGFNATVRLALDRIVRFFRRVANALRGRGFETWADVFQTDIARGHAGARTDETRRADLDRQLKTAWHASPHRFDKFSATAIGTGEGAQSFGWGLYFAGKRQVAEHYQKTFQAHLDIAFTPQKAPLYRVDLAPRDDEYLLWDESLKNQSAKVQGALREYWNKRGWSFPWRPTGQRIYDDLVRRTGNRNERGASMHLARLGIRGIQYRDSNSRGAREDATYNYIIFDDADISIDYVEFQRGKRRDIAPPLFENGMPENQARQQAIDHYSVTRTIKESNTMADTNDHDYEGDQPNDDPIETTTGTLLENTEMFRTVATPLAPVRGEPDPRPVDAIDEQVSVLGPAVDALLDAWAPKGTDIGTMRDDVHWGIVNALHRQGDRVHRDMNYPAVTLKELSNVTTHSEIQNNELVEAAETTQTLYDRVGAFERLHSAAAFHYRQRTGTAWRPKTRRSYVGTQEDFDGSRSTGAASARAVREARAAGRLQPVAVALAPRPRTPRVAGIGSRDAPIEARRLMNATGQVLGLNGFTLRSGAAEGSDQAFEAGFDAVEGEKEIFLPWDGFSDRRAGANGTTAEISDRAYEIAAQSHPNWDNLTQGARKLHARNTHQVLGADCESPVDVVVCWTAAGAGAGGTGQALRIANAHNIPIIDLGAQGAPRRADDVLTQIRATIAPWRQSAEQLDRSQSESREAQTARRNRWPASAYHVVVVGDPDYGEPNRAEAARLGVIEDQVRTIRADPSIAPAPATARITELRNEASQIQRTAEARMGKITDALERLHRKYPSLIVNTLHGTPLGQFATEWAQLNGVRHQTIGVPRAGDLIDLDAANLPFSREGESATLGLPLLAIARRQHAILDLNPRAIVSFGEDRYDTHAYQHLAAERAIPLWSFDRTGHGTAYAAGEAPSLDQLPHTRLPVYAGFGAENAPPEVAQLMTEVGEELAYQDFLLRSGGAQGSDEAFENGARLIGGRRRIYLHTDGLRERQDGVDQATADIPERAFQVVKEHRAGWNTLTEAEQRHYTRENFYERTKGDPPSADIPIPESAFESAKEKLSGWDKLTDSTHRKYARNAMELLGDNLNTPADVVVCWTKDGKPTGITAQALNLAKANNIPVINLGAPDAPKDINAFMQTLRETIRPWGEAVDRAFDRDHAIAPAQIEPFIGDSYLPEQREHFTHNPDTLAYSTQHFDRLLEVVGPNGTQLSDYRARLAWGLVDVLHFQLNKLGKELEARGAPAPGSPERASINAQLTELTKLYENTARHYSAGLGLGSWNPIMRREHGTTQTYAHHQAATVLGQIAGDSLDAHRPENARVIVEGVSALRTLSDYDRLDQYLNRIRDWHQQNEGRDISIVHKSTQPDLLRSWCENNRVHQVVYAPQHQRFGNKAPAMRDHDMVTNPPADRYIGFQQEDATLYTHRHVLDFNQNAGRDARPVRISLVDPSKQQSVPATSRTTAPQQSAPGPRQQSAEPRQAQQPENNVVSIPAESAPLHFNSRVREAAILSNFAATPIKVDGIDWPSVEHYYQAEKLGAVRVGPAERVWHDIRAARNPAEVRQLGRSVPAVGTWEERKVGVMAEALCTKFRPGTEAAEYLLSTGDRSLLHSTPGGRNGDTVWGTGRDGSGDNLLGVMLADCREVLRLGSEPTVHELMGYLPGGYFVDDPGPQRAADFSNALDLYNQSYQAWTQSYRSDEPRVSEAHSARTAELGDAIGRAAAFLNANYERYEDALTDLEIPRETLEARARAADVQTSHDRSLNHNQDQEMGAMRA